MHDVELRLEAVASYVSSIQGAAQQLHTQQRAQELRVSFTLVERFQIVISAVQTFCIYTSFQICID